MNAMKHSEEGRGSSRPLGRFKANQTIVLEQNPSILDVDYLFVSVSFNILKVNDYSSFQMIGHRSK